FRIQHLQGRDGHVPAVRDADGRLRTAPARFPRLVADEPASALARSAPWYWAAAFWRRSGDVSGRQIVSRGRGPGRAAAVDYGLGRLADDCEQPFAKRPASGLVRRDRARPWLFRPHPL